MQVGLNVLSILHLESLKCLVNKLKPKLQPIFVNQVWHNLTAFAEKYPIKDNKGGSLLTMFSKGGFIFGIVNIVGNFGTVFVDQAYWQSAIAAKPHAAHKG